MTRVWGEDGALLDHLGVDVERLRHLEVDLERPRALPGGTTIIDAHVHLGQDSDGHHLSAPDLLRDLDRHGIARAVCFPANEPGADGRFTAANLAVARAAAAGDGRIVPFCRVDPRRPDAVRTLERAAVDGARGLKLHPVAQRFRPEDPAVILLVRAAGERGWPVLIHAGFGARPLGAAIAALADACPDTTLILAHGGRGDPRALARLAADRPRILFDTSLAALSDLVALGPERLCFGSDRPYGDHASALQVVALAARIGGWSDDQLRAVLGANLARLVEGAA